jgi:ribosomal protein S18 acetylase RimI-like enzyme
MSSDLQLHDASVSHQTGALPARFDVRNFLIRRVARPGDDLAIAELLEQSFVSVYERKLQLATPEQRRRELRDVATRRENGVVCVLELGYRIVGTFSLLAPGAGTTQSWLPGAANLRCLAVHPDYQGYGFADLLVR